MFQYDAAFRPDSVIANTILHMAQVLQKEVIGSKRLDYIIATSYLMKGDDAKAIPIFDKLINVNYYALPSLKIIMKYFSEKKG